MPDLLDWMILALRIALVGLLYLFLFLVMRVAIRGLRQSPAAARREWAGGLRLLVLDPADSKLAPGEVIEIAEGGVLGRTERADVVIADPTVSSEHARVSRVGRAWVVADLGSTNGTRVNDRVIDRETSLAAGDELALGSVRLRVVAR